MADMLTWVPLVFVALKRPRDHHWVRLRPLAYSTPSWRGCVWRPLTSNSLTRDEYSSYCSRSLGHSGTAVCIAPGKCSRACLRQLQLIHLGYLGQLDQNPLVSLAVLHKLPLVL